MFSRNAFAKRILSLSLIVATATGYGSSAFAQRTKKQQAAPESAQTAPANPETGGTAAAGGDKLDVSDLENKYWAAKDTDFSVVQNRLFSKANRVAVTMQYGILVNDSWSDGPTFGAAASYYFSERYGMELNYTSTLSKNNQAADRLETQGGVPDHNKMKQFYGAAFNWVPFYAKMSFLNAQIIYFDLSLSPGLGLVEYEQQINTGNQSKTAPAITLDVTQHIFLNAKLALRLDYKNRWYQEDIVTWRPQAGGARNTTTELTNRSLLMIGLTYYF